MDILESYLEKGYDFALKADNGKYFTTNFEDNYPIHIRVELSLKQLIVHFLEHGAWLGGMNTKNEHPTRTTVTFYKSIWEIRKDVQSVRLKKCSRDHFEY